MGDPAALRRPAAQQPGQRRSCCSTPACCPAAWPTA
jgi:hypothetical protein